MNSSYDALQVGKVYQLNDLQARVEEIADDEVIWISPEYAGRKRRSWMLHHCPRWFFEKYAKEPRDDG